MKNRVPAAGIAATVFWCELFQSEGPAVADFVARKAVSSSGHVFVDSRQMIPIEKRDNSNDPADHFESFALGFDFPAPQPEIGLDGGIGSATLTTDGVGYDVAYRVVQDWRLVGIGRF